MKKVRFLFSVATLIIFSIVCFSFAADYKYVGSKTSIKFHYPDCEWPKKITTKNLISFKTVEEAVNAKYVLPCKVFKHSMPKD